jgi:hypothetical protein
MKNNELIAEFMGAIPCVTNTDYLVVPGKGLWYPPDLKYDTDWDWLIPVCQKINKSIIRCESNGVKDSVMPYINMMHKMKKGAITFDLKMCYEGVVDFIKWYNKNK